MEAGSLTYDFAKDAWTEDAFVMVRRGEGERPAPDREPAPGRWFAEASPAKPRERFGISEDLRNLAAAALFALLVVAFLAVPSLAPRMLAAVLLVVLALMLLAFAGRERHPEAEPRDVGLLEHPEDPDVCLVEIRIVRNGEPVGKDRGALWFEGGRLLFSGHRTSFAIGGEDVLPHSRHRPGLPSGALPLRIAGESAHLEFLILRYPELDRTRYERFGHRLLAFRSFTPPARGPRQWPPLAP